MQVFPMTILVTIICFFPRDVPHGFDDSVAVGQVGEASHVVKVEPTVDLSLACVDHDLVRSAPDDEESSPKLGWPQIRRRSRTRERLSLLGKSKRSPDAFGAAADGLNGFGVKPSEQRFEFLPLWSIGARWLRQ
jgi:hypothetical protein